MAMDRKGRSVLGGEEPTAEFEGEGRVWLQTRSVDSPVSRLISKLPRTRTR